MSEGVRAYTTNKILSLLSIVAIIVSSLWYFGYVAAQWQFVMVVLISLAYSHYIIGAYYQLKSFLRKPKPGQQYLTFLFLVALSILVGYVSFQISTVFALLLILFYFLIHSVLNEKVLLLRQTGKTIDNIFAWPLVLIVIGVLAFAIPDHTFLMDRHLSFVQPNEFLVSVVLSSMGLSADFFARLFWVSVVVSFVLLAIGWFRTKQHTLTLSIGLVFLMIVGATYYIGPLPYVYMLFLVVGYHFVTWFLFYVTSFKKRGSGELKKFISIHLLFLLPFFIGGYYVMGNDQPDWSLLMFDYYYFTYATYIHITTSFMNDEWFQTLQNKVFRNG